MLNRIRRVTLPLTAISILVLLVISLIRYIATRMVPTVLLIVCIVLVIILIRLLAWARTQRQIQQNIDSSQAQRR